MKQMNKLIVLLAIAILTFNNLQSQTLSVEDRVYGISKFWSEVNYNFAYFENIEGKKDFDELYKQYLSEVLKEENDYKYYRILQKFCAELGDGHTNVLFPPSIRKNIFYPPIRIRRIKDEIFVINVGKTYVEKIPRGSKILEVNSVPVLEYLKKEVYPYITGAEHIVKSSGAQSMLEDLIGKNKTILIEKPNNEQSEVEILMNGKSEDSNDESSQ